VRHVLRAGPTRILDDRDLQDVTRLLDADPVSGAFVASRIESAGLDPWRLGAEVWGYRADGDLSAICYSGANLVPVGVGDMEARAFADRARRQGRRCSSIFGDAGGVLGLWKALEPTWGRAREVRRVQPLLATDRASRAAADPLVRLVGPDELEVLLPACVAMFTEEVGISPVVGDGGVLYRARVAELVGAGRAFARIEDGEVVFKAEVGAVSRRVCQIQGVWTRPDLRGRGIGRAGTAAVVDVCLRDIAPVVSLYVNEFNHPARRVYDDVGFTQVGTFASVLF
jgi:predicted GNAT family acetyltransferase